MSLFRFLGRLIDRIWPADHGFQWTGQGAIDDAEWDLRPLPKPDPYEAARFAAYGLDPRHNARRSEAARRYWADLDHKNASFSREH